MRELSDKRAVELGEYIIDTGSTVRAAARVFSISKKHGTYGSNNRERFVWLVA